MINMQPKYWKLKIEEVDHVNLLGLIIDNKYESILRFIQCFKKINVQYQLLELISKFYEDLLQRAETFNMNSFIQKK